MISLIIVKGSRLVRFKRKKLFLNISTYNLLNDYDIICYKCNSEPILKRQRKFVNSSQTILTTLGVCVIREWKFDLSDRVAVKSLE